MTMPIYILLLKQLITCQEDTQNNCRYIFIYSFCATPLNRHGYNLKGFRQTFICSQHTNVNLRVNYGCIEPFLFKRERERMKMESRGPASRGGVKRPWSRAHSPAPRPAHTPLPPPHPPEGTALPSGRGQDGSRNCPGKGMSGGKKRKGPPQRRPSACCAGAAANERTGVRRVRETAGCKNAS